MKFILKNFDAKHFFFIFDKNINYSISIANNSNFPKYIKYEKNYNIHNKISKHNN